LTIRKAEALHPTLFDNDPGRTELERATAVANRLLSEKGMGDIGTSKDHATYWRGYIVFEHFSKKEPSGGCGGEQRSWFERKTYSPEWSAVLLTGLKKTSIYCDQAFPEPFPLLMQSWQADASSAHQTFVTESRRFIPTPPHTQM
jgi:hypothetical protein